MVLLWLVLVILKNYFVTNRLSKWTVWWHAVLAPTKNLILKIVQIFIHFKKQSHKQQANIYGKTIFWYKYYLVNTFNYKESACSVGDPGSIPGSGRSPGEEDAYPLQYSCLENPMDRGA